VCTVDLNCDMEIQVAGAFRRFRWGRADELGTAAFWVDQTRRDPIWSQDQRLGANLAEEVGACLLGGFGTPADICIAAFGRLRDAGIFAKAHSADQADIECLLAQPLAVPGRARPVRYRFWKQRAGRLAACLIQVDAFEQLVDARGLRDALLGLPGVGPKTASWIARNHLGSDELAVIDVHIRRAGVAAGFFDPGWRLPADYSLFEEAFVSVAALGQVRTSALDACIWGVLSWLGKAGSVIIERDPGKGQAPSPPAVLAAATAE